MLEDGRARLEVVLEAERVEGDLRHTLGHLVDSAKYPGFRKGKVPPAVVLQRMGREEVFAETMREFLPAWVGEAIAESRLQPGRPAERRLRVGARRGRGVHLHGRVPAAPHGHAARGSSSSRACRSEVEVPAEEVDAEIERLREESSPLVTVDRPAQTGDYVEVDMHVSANGKPVPSASTVGYLVQLGTGRTFEEIERALRGMSAGETRTTELPLPADYPDPKLRNRNADVSLHVHSVQASARRARSTTSSRAPRRSSTRSPSCAPRSRRASATASRRSRARASAPACSARSARPSRSSCRRTSWPAASRS